MFAPAFPVFSHVGCPDFIGCGWTTVKLVCDTVACPRQGCACDKTPAAVAEPLALETLSSDCIKQNTAETNKQLWLLQSAS